MIYAIYLRKSRADLEAEAMGQGETLARHRAALLDYAARHGLEIGAVYEEIISGESIDARPKMKQLLREVEQGRWAGVLCMDIDRLARGDSADQARVSNTFRISGTLIITPSKVYDQSRESDEEYVDFELFMARREYKAISRRIMRGRIASAKEGHFIGSTPPYGYDKVRVEKGRGYTLSPNSESDTVKQIYSMCISGMGCNAIARRLDMMGIEPRKGKSWSGASVQDILRNPVYCGRIRWQYRKEEKSVTDGIVTTHRRDNPECIIAQGLHPALISEEEFDRAQQYLDSRRIPHARENTQLRNPLSGLVYCGMCGSMMTRLGTGSRNHSDTLRCPNRNCNNVSAKLELVESALVEGVARWLNDCRVNVSRKPAADTAKAERTAADKVRAELAKLDSQRERIYSLLEQRVYSAGEFRERMESLEKRRAQLSENLRQAEQAVSEAEGNRQLYSQITPRAERVMDIYAQSTPEEKNRLLKTIISRAEYIKTERNTRENADRCNFTLNVIPLFPEIKTGAE
jgi:DNA invertase Pin-like site-specific DNA recombinase